GWKGLRARIRMKSVSLGRAGRARCGVLSRTDSAAIGAPCVLTFAPVHHTRSTSVILVRALRGGASVAVAEAAHRLDRHLVCRVRRELLAQVADVELHLVRRDAIRVAPDELEQLVAAQHLVGMPDERRQELELE